jgi:hypothetical protein
MVADVIQKHPKPDIIWTAVLSFIASRPDLAGRVTSVTTQRYIHPKLESVDLPQAAQELLNISRDIEDLYAENVYPATMVAPGGDSRASKPGL